MNKIILRSETDTWKLPVLVIITTTTTIIRLLHRLDELPRGKLSKSSHLVATNFEPIKSRHAVGVQGEGRAALVVPRIVNGMRAHDSCIRGR